MTNRSPTTIRTERQRSGMSLTEMMISMAVLSLGILAAASAQLTAMKFTRESELRTEAYYLASQQMEAFQAMTPEQVADVADLGSYPNDVDNNPIDPDPNDDRARVFNRSWDIADDTPVAGLYTITVTVSWQDGSGSQSSIDVQSIKVSS